MKRCRRAIASSVMAESPPIIPITDKFIKNSISLLCRNKGVNIRGNYWYVCLYADMESSVRSSMK